MTLRSLLFVLTAAAISAPATSQMTRVVINGVPTNMSADWSQVVAVPDPVMPDTFVVLMPLDSISSWAQWEPDPVMDLVFGIGNWNQLTMSALEWAYLSPDPCAHQPAPGGSAPESLLTTDFDYGPYTGVAGTPLFPDATYFAGSPQSFVRGLTNSFSLERWQLRTRGFFPSMLWNGCPGSSSVTHNFTGFLAARFTYTIP